MRFPLDMNVPRELGRRLIAAGHECRHVGDIGLAQASDVTIMKEAKGCGETIVTHDLDFGHLLAFSGEALPSVIILRLRNAHPDNLFAAIVQTWPEIEEPLLEGAIVALEDAAYRVRMLPIARDK